MARAHCMLDNQGYKLKLTVCNTYCFSSATTVARTLSSVTLYAHCLSCFLIISPTPRSVGFDSDTKFGGRHIGLISLVFLFLLIRMRGRVTSDKNCCPFDGFLILITFQLKRRIQAEPNYENVPKSFHACLRLL